MRFGAGAIEIGIAEEGLVIARQRTPAEGGDAAIGDARIVVIGVGRVEAGLRTERGGQRRRDADEAAFVEIAIVVEFLVRRVEAQRDIVAERLVRVTQNGEGAEIVDRGLATDARTAEHRGLGHAIDRAAARATPEDQGIGALQHFDSLDIVERAVILRVVAQAVDVEIGSRFLAADKHFVAVAFAALHADAGDIAQCIVQLADRLIFQLVFGDEADALGNVD